MHSHPSPIQFLAFVIDRYEQRLTDHSLPLFIRSEFSKALAGYKERYKIAKQQLVILN